MTSFSILFARFKGDLTSAGRGHPGRGRPQARRPHPHRRGLQPPPHRRGHRPREDPALAHAVRGRQARDRAQCRATTSPTTCRRYGPGHPLRRLHASTAARCCARILRCKQAGVPITNYGLAIAYSLGIFERALQPFPAALETLRAARARRAGHAAGGAGDGRPAPGRGRRRDLLTEAAMPATDHRPAGAAGEAGGAPRLASPGGAGPSHADILALAARGRPGAARAALWPRRTRLAAATSATRCTCAASSRSPTTACAPAATAACAPATASIERYRMSADEILELRPRGRRLGLRAPWSCSPARTTASRRSGSRDVVRRIKAETGLAVTLSLGERPEEDLAAWREAGADRYLLRFETSDDELYRLIHPRPAGPHQRPHGHPAQPAAPRLRGRQRRHGRHPRPDVRERRRRHRALPRPGPRHDRHRPVHRPSR